MILIVGCGFLGSYILKNAKLFYPNEKIIATYNHTCPNVCQDNVELVQCDVTRVDDLKGLSKKCNNEELIVFYFSACHNIDFVYEYPSEANEVNVCGLKQFYEYVANIKKLFFASTDCVYGEGDYFDESSLLCPINEYGKQKKQAEEIVLNHSNNVFRLPFMYGSSNSNRNSFYDNIVKSLSENKKCEMIDGMMRNALTYDKVSNLILSLSKIEDLPSIINICADKCISKYDVGIRIARETGYDKSLICKISEQEGSKFFKDRRANCINMNNQLLKGVLNLKEVK